MDVETVSTADQSLLGAVRDTLVTSDEALMCVAFTFASCAPARSARSSRGCLESSVCRVKLPFVWFARQHGNSRTHRVTYAAARVA